MTTLAALFEARRKKISIWFAFHKLQQDMSTVFVPTTPNPTSGFLLFVPTKDIVMLDMGVEDAAKMIVSLGLVMPDSKERAED